MKSKYTIILLVASATCGFAQNQSDMYLNGSKLDANTASSNDYKNSQSKTVNLKVIEIDGVGETQAKAKEDAYRNAVEKAVGIFISADLISKNDQIIKDEVLNFSAGYIERSEVLSINKRLDGLFSVRIRAVVAQNKLTRQLEKMHISIASIDSESLFAEAKTSLNRREDSYKIWEKLFKDFWSKAFKSEVSDKPEIFNGSGSNVQAYFSVDVKFDNDFIREFENVLRSSGPSVYVGEIHGMEFLRNKYGNSGYVCLVNKSDYDSSLNRFGRFSRAPIRHKYVDSAGVDLVYSPYNKETGGDFPRGYHKLGSGVCAAPDFDIKVPLIHMIYKANGYGRMYEAPVVMATLKDKYGSEVAKSFGALSGSINGVASFFMANDSREDTHAIFFGDVVTVRSVAFNLKINQLELISKIDVKTHCCVNR